ncbi:MAG: hypothetical protein QM796_05300 [Chthoniobacteraceae bacterium]
MRAYSRLVLLAGAGIALFHSQALAQSGSFSDLNVTGVASVGGLKAGSGAQIGSNNNSIAIGRNANASGADSMAFGLASTSAAVQALSFNSSAHGYDSVAMTYTGYTGPDASYSFAFGGGAFGFNCFATPGGTAAGDCSLAIGNATYAAGVYQTVTGCWNQPKGHTDFTYYPHDPVFIIGNGNLINETDVSTSTNALEVYWNGDAWLQGQFSASKVRVPETGDLKMGQFTNSAAGAPAAY